jgi:hypothetical protein
MKPAHRGGYTALHTDLCERTLVSLMRGLGPWKLSVYLVGGLVPRYLIDARSDPPAQTRHIGTTDVDLVLDLGIMADIEAYRRLEQNLQRLGFQRGSNDEGQAQHFSWRKPIQPGVTIVVDLLCDDRNDAHAGHAVAIPGERRLSALVIPGAHLVIADHLTIPLTAELLDEAGVATETIRIANIVPFLVLKCLAFEDRNEPKDAYDIIYALTHYGYALTHYGQGPEAVAAAIRVWQNRQPAEPLIARTLAILRDRFASDQHTPGYRKNGAAQYARFLTDPGQPERNALHRRQAAATIDRLLDALN